eukprot:gene10991-3697_t
MSKRLYSQTTLNLPKKHFSIFGKKTKEFIIHNGFRYVVPYEFVHDGFCKGRWFEKELVEVYSKEYSVPKEICSKMISKGLIKVNYKEVKNDYVIKNGDKCQYTNGNILEPVSLYFDEIEVIFEDDDLFVINKPCSVPVHSSGRYRKNSLDYLLKEEFGIEFDLKLTHRLDRVTTGVLIFAKNTKMVTKIGKLIENGKFKKYYLARVSGYLKPDEILLVDKFLYLEDARRARWRFVENDKKLEELKKSLPSSSYLKSAETIFLSLGYDEKTESTLIFCAPQTGRTHQLRQHLKSLNLVIINDDFHENKIVKKENYWEENFDENFNIKEVDPIKEIQNPDTSSMMINLHAFKYFSENGDYEFETKNLPKWTNDFKFDLQVGEKKVKKFLEELKKSQ